MVITLKNESVKMNLFRCFRAIRISKMKPEDEKVELILRRVAKFTTRKILPIMCPAHRTKLGGGRPLERRGCSYEILKRTPQRYQNYVF